MKRITVSCLFLSALPASAEIWTGTLVDVMCKGKDLAGHTRECALTCAKSGFGVVLADGKFLKFDEAGNAKTLSALKVATKEKDLKAQVTGEKDGETIQVTGVDLK